MNRQLKRTCPGLVCLFPARGDEPNARFLRFWAHSCLFPARGDEPSSENLVQILVGLVSKEVESYSMERRNDYQVNFTAVLSLMKNTMILLFIRKDFEVLLSAMLQEFQRTLSPIRPGRSYPRKHQRQESAQNSKPSTNLRANPLIGAHYVRFISPMHPDLALRRRASGIGLVWSRLNQ